MEYNLEHVKDALRKCLNSIMSGKSVLEALDSNSGDGDLGISMYKGSEAVLAEMDKYSGTEIGMLFMKSAMAMNNAAPSTMGTLLAAGLMQLGKFFGKKETVTEEEIVNIPFLFADAIMMRGKAKEGDRTILDALLPLAREFKNASIEGKCLSDALKIGLQAAEKGAEHTKELIPQIGRAKWAPDNAKGVVDGGSMLCVITVRGLVE